MKIRLTTFNNQKEDGWLATWARTLSHPKTDSKEEASAPLFTPAVMEQVPFSKD